MNKLKHTLKNPLKKFVHVFEPDKEIGCIFKEDDGSIDLIENDSIGRKYYKSSQISDVGTRPIEMRYTPINGVSWVKFIAALEIAFEKHI